VEKTDYKFPSKVRDSLLKDETVLWVGRPEPFPLTNKSNKMALMLRWIVCAVLLVALSAGYVVYSMGIPAGFKPSVIVVFVVVFGFIMLSPVFDHNKVIKKCLYIVTDKRVIVAVSDTGFHAVGRAGLKVNALPAENGCVHLLFGAAVDTPAKKLITRAIVPVKADDGEVSGIMFCNVKNTQEMQGFFNY